MKCILLMNGDILDPVIDLIHQVEIHRKEMYSTISYQQSHTFQGKCDEEDSK